MAFKNSGIITITKTFRNDLRNTFLSHDNASIDRKIYFARGSTCKLLSRGYGNVTFPGNYKEANTKLICLVKDIN